MTIAKTIALAQSHHRIGNAEAARRILEFAIRAALSKRAADAYRAALADMTLSLIHI